MRILEKPKCHECKFRHKNKQGRYECQAVNDKAYREAMDDLWDCPFYKERKEKNDGK